MGLCADPLEILPDDDSVSIRSDKTFLQRQLIQTHTPCKILLCCFTYECSILGLVGDVFSFEAQTLSSSDMTIRALVNRPGLCVMFHRLFGSYDHLFLDE